MTEKERENLRNLLTTLRTACEILENLLQEGDNSRHISGDVTGNAFAKGNGELENYVSNFLWELGIPVHMNGYQYITTAILMLIKDNFLSKSHKLLYADLADIYKTTPSSIERGIRYAKSVAWSDGNLELINKIFNQHIRIPTNKVFLYTIAEYLILNKSVN